MLYEFVVFVHVVVVSALYSHIPLHFDVFLALNMRMFLYNTIIMICSFATS